MKGPERCRHRRRRAIEILLAVAQALVLERPGPRAERWSVSEEGVPYDGVDEFTPRERGLMIGYEFASTWPGHSPDDRELLGAWPTARCPRTRRRDARRRMRERLEASVDPHAAEAFRGGFADGPATLAIYNRAYRARIDPLLGHRTLEELTEAAYVRAGP